MIEEKETNDKNSSTTTHTYKYDDDGHMIEDIRKSDGDTPVHTITTYDYSDPTRVCRIYEPGNPQRKLTTCIIAGCVCARTYLKRGSKYDYK